MGRPRNAHIAKVEPRGNFLVGERAKFLFFTGLPRVRRKTPSFGSFTLFRLADATASFEFRAGANARLLTVVLAQTR